MSAKAALPNFLPEDYLALLRAAVALGWGAVIGMAGIKVAFHLAGAPWPELLGFALTYDLMLGELTGTAILLSVLALRRDWFEGVPREASARLRTLLTLVVAWLCVHHLAAFHMLGGLQGPVLAFLPVLVLAAFLSLPRTGAWTASILLIAGHAVVVLLEQLHWVHTPGPLAHAFALERPAGLLVILAAIAAAVGFGALARRRFDQAGANVHRDNRINPLTGLYEQEFFMERLDSELRRLGRQRGGLSCLFLEFEGFYEYTRDHGYLEGRQALRRAAQILIGNTRHEMDTPSRYAPTTFALLLPDAGREYGESVARRIGGGLASIAGGALRLRAAMVCVSKSGVTSDAVLAAARSALLRARDEGADFREVEL